MCKRRISLPVSKVYTSNESNITSGILQFKKYVPQEESNEISYFIQTIKTKVQSAIVFFSGKRLQLLCNRFNKIR